MEQKQQVQDSTQREHELLEKYVTTRKNKEMLEAQSKDANKKLEDATAELVTFLQDNEKRSTGKYDDLGSLTIKEPALYISKKEGTDQDVVFEYFKANGGEGCIKQTIAPATLTSFVKEQIEKGLPVPEFINTFYKTSVLYIAPKKS